MASLDVVSLFTDIPVTDTSSQIFQYIQDNSIPLEIPLDELKQSLFLRTKNVQFQLSGEIYLQIDGVAMGSPSEQLFADIIYIQAGEYSIALTYQILCLVQTLC